MKVLMFGWEFPPFHSGGLGVACEGLAKALALQGSQIIFVLPKKLDCKHPFLKIIFADENLEVKVINSLLKPYVTSASYKEMAGKIGLKDFYDSDLFREVLRYSHNAQKIAKKETFDIIHSHDWLSFPAGIAAKNISSKPLVCQIHATEFDRSPHCPNPVVYAIEKIGMEKADVVVAVSNYTKNKIIENYGIDGSKIKVVHNAIDPECFNQTLQTPNQLLDLKSAGKKIVLFVGRITLQKGPDYFLKAAKKVLAYNFNIIFIVAGSGDMERQIIEETANLGIADKFLFAGFLQGEDLKKVYTAADLFVMPSVSEPFGLTALESVSFGTPVLVSKQSGVSEVIKNALKVDFWDIDEMANKILACLNYPVLNATLQNESQKELTKLSWQKSAQKCIDIYSDLLKNYA
ncbi:MAG: glycosyltransferase family 4 protein [Candidatus Pacebacteria bacterium]|nr:glycosyltransferase family 4 protein [Candidatus Paceibacterota bacterium]